MNIKSWIGLTLCVGLLGCAAPPKPPSWEDAELRQQRYAQAREAFVAGRYVVAASLMQPLAQRGHAGAQYALGYLYYTGQGRERDAALALKWFRAAALAGDEKAVDALVRMARKGLEREAGARALTAPAD